MASLSRGLFAPGLRPLCNPRNVLAEFSIARCRPFTTTNHLRSASKPAVKVVKSVNTKLPPKNSPSVPISTTNYALIRSLAIKPKPTTLYDGPSHFWFYFGCWTSGLFLLTWTFTTGGYLIIPAEGAPKWTGWAYTVVYALFASIGFWLITKTSGIVQSIRVIPRKAVAAATKPGAAVPPPQLEVTVKSMVPFMKPRVLTKELEAVRLKTRFSLPDEYVPELKRLRLQEEEEKRRAALHKFDMAHILTMPFRRMIRAFTGLYQGVLSAWTDKGMGVLLVDDKRFKVDVTRGFAHEGFRTLERVVKIEGR